MAATVSGDPAGFGEPDLGGVTIDVLQRAPSRKR